MNFFDSIQSAKDREAEPREDRPAMVDGLLENDETLGYKQADPLGNVPYSEYPTNREELLLPSTTRILQSIANSDVVTDVRDLSDELDVSASVVGDAVDFHRIDLPMESDQTPSPLVELPDGDGGTVTVDKTEFESDFITAYALYVTAGLSSDEIGTLTDKSERQVRAVLREHSLL